MQSRSGSPVISHLNTSDINDFRDRRNMNGVNVARSRSTRFDDHTRGELRRLAPDTTVVVPIGSTEQHGPHLPVCTDSEMLTYLALRAVDAAAEFVPVLVTPTLPFGLAQHHLSFGGTISFSAKVYLDVLSEIGTSLVSDGFQRIVFLNGHGGNANAAAMVADRLVHELQLNTRVASASYWDCAAESLEKLDLDGAPIPGHAGTFETCCMLAMRPDLVQTNSIPQAEEELQPIATQSAINPVVRSPGIWQRSDGRTDDSHYASVELGRKALEMIVTDVRDFIIAFHHGDY